MENNTMRWSPYRGERGRRLLSFVTGMADAFVLLPYIESDESAVDKEAIARDWKAVGSDLRAAFDMAEPPQ